MLSSINTQATVQRLCVVALVAVFLSPALVTAQFGAVGTQFLDQDSPAVPDANEISDQFGHALATGDFDGDGYPDLVVDTRLEDVNGVLDAGQITVIRGSAAGIDPVLGAELWSEGLGLLTGDPDELDHFGYSVATGDFNDDLIDDLAISVYGGDPVIDGLPVSDAGEVYVLWGSGVGLTHLGHQTIRRGDFGLPGEPVPGNRFGSTLTSGDFDGDGVDDLALGSSDCAFEPPAGPNVQGAGCFGVLYGSAAGLDASPGGGIPGSVFDLASFGWAPAEFDGFGGILTTGDFDGNGFDDLAAAATGRDVQGLRNAGVAFIFWGSEDGLTAVDVQKIHRGMPGLWGSPEENDRLGSALATGDFDGDGAAELAIGVDDATLLVEHEGLAYIVPGVLGGALDMDATELLTQGILTGNALEIGAFFGSAVAAGDFDGDGVADLAVSARAADPDEVANAGLAWIVHGDPAGLEIGTAQEISHADVAPGTSQPDDNFGERLLVADLDSNGASDLVVGMPHFSIDQSGGIDVFYSSPTLGPSEIFSDGFESEDFSAWSSVVGD